MGDTWEASLGTSARVPRVLCVPMWPSNFSLSPSEVTQALETAFSLRKGLRSTKFVTEDDLRACGLSSGESSQVVGERAGSSIVAILPAVYTPFDTNVDVGGGDCHCTPLFLLSASYPYLQFINPFLCCSRLRVRCCSVESRLYQALKGFHSSECRGPSEECR